MVEQSKPKSPVELFPADEKDISERVYKEVHQESLKKTNAPLRASNWSFYNPEVQYIWHYWHITVDCRIFHYQSRPMDMTVTHYYAWYMYMYIFHYNYTNIHMYTCRLLNVFRYTH